VAAGEAATFLTKLGMANVEARSLYLANYLKQKLGEIPGMQMLTPMEPSLSAAVLKFRIAGKNTRQLGLELWAKHRISGAVSASGPLEGIRWCPHVYNNRAELDRAVEGLRSLL
jgi:selenocysteine lyase/cysteine desulfurase